MFFKLVKPTFFLFSENSNKNKCTPVIFVISIKRFGTEAVSSKAVRTT